MAETNVNDIITIDIVNNILVNTLENINFRYLTPNINEIVKVLNIVSYRINDKIVYPNHIYEHRGDFLIEIAKYLYPQYTNEFDNDILLTTGIYRKYVNNTQHFKYDENLNFFISTTFHSVGEQMFFLSDIAKKLKLKVFLINFKKKENTNIINNNVNIKQQIINEYENNKDYYDEENNKA